MIVYEDVIGVATRVAAAEEACGVFKNAESGVKHTQSKKFITCHATYV